jgi:acetyl-CoA acetyltransferase
MSLISGVGLTPYGRLEGRDTLALMSEPATMALAHAGLERGEVDGLLTGYSTTHPHLMLSTVFAEHFGLTPTYAHAIQLGGATGFGLVMLAHLLVEGGVARRILVVAGENRLTGQSRDSAIQTLAQVGHSAYEVPLGPTIPTYYGLVASRYMHEFGSSERDFAELAVLMRANAVRTPGAQLRDPIKVEDVLASKPIAAPLKLMDCCPVSDGGAAFIVEREDTGRSGVRIIGTAQTHMHQHVTAAASLTAFGAGDCTARALTQAGVALSDIRYAGIYDSFTVTLAILLEEIGLAPRGGAGSLAREGHFSPDGAMPLNTHGGLLSYGHCGVAGAMAHLVETVRQMRGEAGERQIQRPSLALLHGDGGVLSSHVSLVVEATR